MAKVIVKFSSNDKMNSAFDNINNYMNITSTSNLINYMYGIIPDDKFVTNVKFINAIDGVVDIVNDSNVSIRISTPLKSQLDRIKTGLPPTTIAFTGSYTIADAINQHNSNESYNRGFHGKNVIIAICDTGIDTSNPMIGNNKVISRAVFEDINEDVLDGVGHGTWVASAAAGNELTHPDYGYLTGVAPEASLLDIVVFNTRGEGSLSSIIQGFTKAIELGAHIISFSGGGDKIAEAELSQVSERLFLEYGVLTIASAGNDGESGNMGTINAPSSNLYSIAVGAVDQFNSRASFSSLGPAYTLVKPDICASGVNIIAACSGYLDMTNDGFEPLSGTSMATPIISGMFALRKQYENTIPVEDRILLDRVKIESQLAYSGTNIDKDIYTGWGSINIDQFVLTPFSEVEQIEMSTIEMQHYIPNQESLSTETKILCGLALLLILT